MNLPAIAGAMFVAVTVVVLGDTAGKALAGMGVHPFLIGWSRFLLAFLLLAPALGPVAENLRLSLRWPLAIRGATIAGGISCILTALRTEPVANAYGAFFIGPVVAYLLSILWLGERVSPARSLLMALGFAGVMLVVQPRGDFRFGILFALAAGCFYGLYLTLTRRLAGRYRAGTMLFSQLLWGAVLLAVPGLAWSGTRPGSAAGLGLIVVSALASAAGNYMIVRISRVVPGSVVAPLVYLQLISAAAMGWLAFGALPDRVAMAGLAVITASGLAALWFARGELRR